MRRLGPASVKDGIESTDAPPRAITNTPQSSALLAMPGARIHGDADPAAAGRRGGVVGLDDEAGARQYRDNGRRSIEGPGCM